MAGDLKQKAAKGLFWKFIEQGGSQLIQFGSGIYIARILSPEDYGLVGMMAIFLGISQMFIESGFKATLIQKGDDVTHDEYNVVFIFNVTISTLIYLLILVGAPYIAEFYNEPKLVPVARILGLNLVIISFGIIHQTILEKRLNFRTLSKIRLVSIFISVIIGVVMASKGFAVWSLVGMTISENFIRTGLFLIINTWRPTISFNVNAFKLLFTKGMQIFLAGTLQQVNNNVYALAIGRFFTTADVGFYSQGQKLQKRIGDFINSSIQGVMYPVQSLMKDDLSRLKNAVRKNVKITTLISFPAIVGLIAIAKSFVLIFLTEKWLPSVYYLQILSVASMIYVLRASSSSYLMALGKFKIVAGLSALNSLLLFGVIALGIFFKVSAEILVLGKVVQEFLGFMVLIYYSKKILNYNIVEKLTDFMPALIYSILIGAVVFAVGEMFGINLIILGLQTLIGATLYILLNFVFNRKTFLEILEMGKSVIVK